MLKKSKDSFLLKIFPKIFKMYKLFFKSLDIRNKKIYNYSTLARYKNNGEKNLF
jgi:hypothetical protein